MGCGGQRRPPSTPEAPVANVFISHSSADNDWAEKIYVWLEEDRPRSFSSTVISMTGLSSATTGSGASTSGSGGRTPSSALCRRRTSNRCGVPPRSVPHWRSASSCFRWASTRQNERHNLLKTLQGVDAAKDPEAAREALRSRLTVIDGGGGWGWPDGKPPYPGLRPFELGEHRVFFGRSHEISSITKRLRSSERAQSAILMVVGPSGCGKSSLVRAGVLPRISGEDYWLSLPPIVPGIDPLGSLIRAIADLHSENVISFDVKSLREDIERDGLKAVATRSAPRCGSRQPLQASGRHRSVRGAADTDRPGRAVEIRCGACACPWRANTGVWPRCVRNTSMRWARIRT